MLGGDLLGHGGPVNATAIESPVSVPATQGYLACRTPVNLTCQIIRGGFEKEHLPTHSASPDLK
jgi:hypothetical protein